MFGILFDVRRPPRSPASSVVMQLSLLSLQWQLLHALWSLLLEDGAGHFALGVELEFEDRATGILEARLGARVHGDFRVIPGLHEQPVSVAAEDCRKAGRRLVLADVTIEDSGRHRDSGEL